MKRLMLILALFTGFALVSDDASAHRWRRARVIHRRHVIRPVYRVHARPVIVQPRVHYQGYYPHYNLYQRGRGVVYGGTGIWVGIGF